MTRSSWGAALTSGLLAGAVGLACLLGAVLRLSAVPQDAPRSANLHDAERGPRSTPVRSRDCAPEDDDLARLDGLAGRRLRGHLGDQGAVDARVDLRAARQVGGQVLDREAQRVRVGLLVAAAAAAVAGVALVGLVGARAQLDLEVAR